MAGVADSTFAPPSAKPKHIIEIPVEPALNPATPTANYFLRNYTMYRKQQKPTLKVWMDPCVVV
jgi:hypothetical protein